MLFYQFSEPESPVEFARQDQAAVGSDAGTSEIELERDAEGELKALLCISPIGYSPPRAFSSHSHPHDQLMTATIKRFQVEVQLGNPA